MPIVARILLVLLLVAAVPLRAYAAVSNSVCNAHHGGAVAVQAPMHEHSSDEPQVSHGHEPEAASPASACSACAGCCVGPSHAPAAVRLERFGPTGADRIAYLGKQVPVHVTGRLDRPPLAL